ncbi:MAG: rRNA maturation RNase YbeY [Bacteroidetes bacterium 41-46]|nr:MAG: rRNA maturation RNase YbeY [Bacteroidetes bacterium 41-46]
MIKYNIEDIDFNLKQRRKLSAWINTVVLEESHRTNMVNGLVLGDINFIFCSDEYLLKINKQFLNHDYYTDIITFDYSSDTLLSGDLFISVERVLENSKIYKTVFQEELRRVMIHGILHLMGYKDSTNEESKKMREAENGALSLFTSQF